jgi:hypothetical protein
MTCRLAVEQSAAANKSCTPHFLSVLPKENVPCTVQKKGAFRSLLFSKSLVHPIHAVMLNHFRLWKKIALPLLLFCWRLPV